MIDYIVATAHIESLQFINSISPFKWKNLSFTPKYRNDSIIGFESNYNGLRVFLTQNQIRISNSLHKFLKGNNYSDFSFSEIIEAIKKICENFEIKEHNWIINKLEFGFNIMLENSISENLNIFHSYKNRFFQKMMHKHNDYGRKCFMSEYSLKIYDKTLHIKFMEKIFISNNITRIEFCYNQKRKLPKPIKTLQDLIDKEKFKLLFKELKEAFLKIIYNEEINLTSSSFEERLLYYATLNSDFLRVEKKLNKIQLKEIKIKIKQLREKYYKTTFKEELIKQLDFKYIQLYCS